jgi:maltose-binding protein MalE
MLLKAARREIMDSFSEIMSACMSHIFSLLGRRRTRAQNLFLICLVAGALIGKLHAEEKTVNLLFFHFEPRSYQLHSADMPDSINSYIDTYRDYLYDPNALKQHMLGDYDFALDQIAQKQMFALLDDFKKSYLQNNVNGSDIKFKVHFLEWWEAFDVLQKEARNPTFDVMQIAQEFLGGLADYGNVVPLDDYVQGNNLEMLYNQNCLKSCRIKNKGDLLALPFWASMRTLFIRKDMLAAVPEIDTTKLGSNWDEFEKAGRLFNEHIPELRQSGFSKVKSFWAINISDKDMNTLQTLTPAIYSHGGKILQDKLWWQEIAFQEPAALRGIKKFYEAAKLFGTLEECSFGELLDNFHSGHYAVVMSGSWEHAYWQNTSPDSSIFIDIKLPPAGPLGSSTLLWGCNLVLLKHPQKDNYDLEYELINYLSTNPNVQFNYIPSNTRLSVLKSAQDRISPSDYYSWLSDPQIAKSYPNSKEMYSLSNSLTHKFRLVSILQNVRGAPELSPEVWTVLENTIRATADDLNRVIIPKPIYFIFYSKINILVILVLLGSLGFLLVRLGNKLRHTVIEKGEIEADLTERLTAVNQEKEELENQRTVRIQKLEENEATISTLLAKLETTRSEFESLKSQANLDKIEQYSALIQDLTQKNKSMRIELEETTRQIKKSESVLSQLEGELEDLTKPEIYFDFRDKTIRKKDGAEFILSSAARQYKNDVFKYLEFIVRHRLERIHLLFFGFLDLPFFQKAIEEQKVREFNYSGKFAKVKSGINRTFKNNIGRDFVIQDDGDIFVYYKDRDSIFRIESRDKKITIDIQKITTHDRPQVLTLPAYHAFDYYIIDKSILNQSNIQESANQFQEALAREGDEKVELLGDALEQDPQNYDALVLLLKFRPFEYQTRASYAYEDIREKVEQLKRFLETDLVYEKKVSNFSKVKEDYKEMYSWNYLERGKSTEFEKVCAAAFKHILEFERQHLKVLLERYQAQEKKIKYFIDNMKNLKDMGTFFLGYLDKTLIQEKTPKFMQNWDSTEIIKPVEELNRDFVAHLCKECQSQTEYSADINANVLLDFIVWMKQRANQEEFTLEYAVSEFCESNNVNKDGGVFLQQFYRYYKSI